MIKFECTGCNEFTVKREGVGFPQEPCPNCGYIGDGEYGSAYEQYRMVER